MTSRGTPFRLAFAGMPLIGRTLFVCETLVGIVVLGWSLLFGHPRVSAIRRNGTDRTGALRVVASLALVVLAAALIAGVGCHVRLSRILAGEILAGDTMALELYACVLVLSGVVAFALRVWPLRVLHMVLDHRDLLERRAHRLLVWVAVVLWAGRLLDYLGLLQPALSLGSAIMATNLKRGSISISLGEIIAFVLTVWVAYLVSAFIRFALRSPI